MDDETGTSPARSPIQLRTAGPPDAVALADLYVRARLASVPDIPPPVHSRESILLWVRDVVLVERRTWVAEADRRIVGILVLEDPDWVDQLYVDPVVQGRGIGTVLLQRALEHSRGQARLWCFESNTRARSFYERHGFVATVRTAGDNEEGAPDILYVRS